MHHPLLLPLIIVLALLCLLFLRGLHPLIFILDHHLIIVTEVLETLLENGIMIEVHLVMRGGGTDGHMTTEADECLRHTGKENLRHLISQTTLQVGVVRKLGLFVNFFYLVYSTTVWVGHLSKNITNEQLKEMMVQFGPVKSVDVRYYDNRYYGNFPDIFSVL